jgi:hypothetical protein
MPDLQQELVAELQWQRDQLTPALERAIIRSRFLDIQALLEQWKERNKRLLSKASEHN